MIKNTKEQTKLEFGVDDICVNGECYMDNDNKAIGLVMFSNQKPKEINSVGERKSGMPYKLDDFQVLMTFANKESIDLVIKQLQQAKKDMESSKNEKD